MKNIFIKTIIAVGVLLISFYFVGNKVLNLNPTVEAVGDLFVDFGVAHSDDPLFHLANMAPGDSVTKTMSVQNSSSDSKKIALRGIKTSETGNIAHAFTITITENNVVLYGGAVKPKTLADFFLESAGPNGVYLSDISPGKNTHYSFLVQFPKITGNEFQAKQLAFDLQVGITIQIPTQCNDITFTGKPIYGTRRNDRLVGTVGNDLIIGFEGNDVIDGRGGNDCILGGEGNDIISGGSGDDKIYGNEDNDILIGSKGQDILIGGSGVDMLYGGAGRDQCEGEKKIGCEL